METVKFEELGLYPQLLRAIKEMGFEEATPIQSQAIPVVMSGVDVIGQAQTGTGKTASFGIPLLMKVDPNNKKTQAIVLSPTRELAIQSAEEIQKFAEIYACGNCLPVLEGIFIARSWLYLTFYSSAHVFLKNASALLIAANMPTAGKQYRIPAPLRS